MPLTTAQVDRLGERLKAGPLTDQHRELLLEFRSSFLPAYEEVVAGIRQSFGFDPTGRPEKTPESIIAKLRRSDTKLSRMQDIAGCRIVVGDRQQQNHVVERLGQLFPNARLVDRRQAPSYGYRAIHVIVRAQRRQVEVQVRTELQDRWANVVERLSDDFGADFKHGQEAPDGTTLHWLMRGSDCLDRVERDEAPQFLGDMNPVELSLFRRGQFNGVMLVAPYIRELSDEAVPADL